MKTKVKAQTPTTLLSAALRWTGFAAMSTISIFGLSACMENPTEIVQTDFSETAVTAQTAGHSLAGSFAQTKEWDVVASNPTDNEWMKSVFSSSETLKKRSALRKMATTSGEVTSFEIDSAESVVHITKITQISGTTIEEKIDAKWDDAAKDSISDNEHFIRFSKKQTTSLGKIESAVFVDGDDDGIINAMSKDSKVKITFESSEGKKSETSVMVIGCGPDLDFDDDRDNQIFQATWNRMQSGMMQAEAAFIDGDNDGIVVDNADTSVVVVQFSDYEPADRPLVKERQAHAKVRIFGKDKGDEPLNFGYTETMKNGRVNTVSMKNRLGGEDLIPNDTMTVLLETIAKRADDTLKTLSLEFVMNPGHDLKSEADDSAYAFHIHSTKQFGFEREAEFHFYAEPPVLHGQEPTAGHFEGMATYANGKSATLRGEFSPKGFSAEYTGPEGAELSVDYSLAGILMP